MKPTITLIIIFLSFLSCKKEVVNPQDNSQTNTTTDNLKTANCQSYFYYYQNQPLSLGQALTEKISIGFTKETSKTVIEQIVSSNKLFSSIESFNENTTTQFVIVILRNGLKCADVENALQALESNRQVLYAHPFLRIGDSPQVVGITDEFIVSLKENVRYSQLQDIANQANTHIVDSLGFGTYILSATQQSQGNTLENANDFYEQNLFKTSEPNFFVSL